jgi:hypothetical protein
MTGKAIGWVKTEIYDKLYKMLNHNTKKINILKQIATNLNKKWYKLQKGGKTRPATCCLEFVSMCFNKDTLTHFAINHQDQFERGLSSLRTHLIDNTSWNRIQAIADVLEKVCDILTKSEDPNLKLSESLTTFWKLAEINDELFVIFRSTSALNLKEEYFDAFKY